MLRRLVELTQETGLLAVYDPARREMMLAASVESPQPIREVRQLDEWLPVYAGATGQAIMAFLSAEERRQILTGPLPARTRRTVVDPVRIEAILEQVRDRGYAVTIGERTLGSAGVAAPIFGPDDRVVGSLGVTGPEQRFSPDVERQRGELLVELAAELSYQLGAPESRTRSRRL